MLCGRLLASLALLLVPVGPCFASATAVAIEQRLAALPAGARTAVGSETVRGSDLVTEFYRRRSYEPAWVGGSGVDELAEALGRSAEQGLDPRDYHFLALAELRRAGTDSPDAAAGLDLLLTDALVGLAYDVRYGRVQAAQIDPLSLRSHPLVSADPVADLEQAVAARRVGELLEALEPATPYYGALKKLLAGQREIAAAGGWPTVPPGPSLKAGMRQERVPALRKRLAATGDLRAEAQDFADLYDDAVVDGVKAFQDRHGLDADGAVGPQTLAALQVPVEARIEQVRANLERARWLLRELPPRYVMVNTAGFRALLADDGKAAWRSRVIVGKPETATPMFRTAIRSVVLNPTWTVPPSIVRGEFPAEIARDPGYLSRKHISVVNGRHVQAPGPDHARGRLKLNMPNPYAVYMHDTPTRTLFSRAFRAFSHGCVRVQDPVGLAVLALDDPRWTAASLETAIAEKRTREILVKEPLPVIVASWSASLRDDGTAEFFTDLYGRDADLLGRLAAAR